MLNGQLIDRWSGFKNNVVHFWDKFSENHFEVVRNSFSHIVGKISRSKVENITPQDIHLENYHYESHRFDDLPLTLNKDPGPGVKYGYTENSEFARGADKTEAYGIDSFGEEDTFDPDEADEYQDFRNRNQNSDLSKRYPTRGLDINNRDLRR